MSPLTALRLVLAKWRYLANPTLPGDGGGAGHNLSGALENEVDLAHRTLRRSAWGDGAALALLLGLGCIIPAPWRPLLLIGGLTWLLGSSARDVLRFAPFLPKLDALVRAATQRPISTALSARPKPKLPADLILPPLNWPPLLRHELNQALNESNPERLRELCAAYCLLEPQAQPPASLAPALRALQRARSAELERRGLTFGQLPSQCGGNQMYPGMPYPCSLLPELLAWCNPTAPSAGALGGAPLGSLLLGFGAPWTSELQRQTKMLLSDGRTVAKNPEIQGIGLFHHNLGAAGFSPITLPEQVADLHCLITGTTGSGKTTMLNLLVAQSILKGRPTIVIDPKGDPSLKLMLVTCLEQAGRDPLTELKCCDLLTEPAPPITAPLRTRLRQERTVQEVLPEISPRHAAIYGQEQTVRSPAYAKSAEQITQLCHQQQQQLDHELLVLTNVGLDPLGALSGGNGGSVAEMAEVLCSNLPNTGQAASFTAHTIRAMECAIYCAQLIDHEVTIDTIRTHYCNWDSLEQGVRLALNHFVETINLPKISIFYNRCHGIKLSDFAGLGVSPAKGMSNAYLVRAVFGASLQGEVSATKFKQAVRQLVTDELLPESTKHSTSACPGCVAALHEEICAVRTLLSAADLEQLKALEPPAPAPSKRRRTKQRAKSSAKQNANSSAPEESLPKESEPKSASLEQLRTFYHWLQQSQYDTRALDAPLTALWEVLSEDKGYFTKVAGSGRTIFNSFASSRMQALLCNGNGQNVSLESVITQNQVLYLNLTSLKNATAARLVGTMVLRSLAQLAAGRIEQVASAMSEQKVAPVDIYIDEASTLASSTLLDLLNKTRAAKYHLTLLAQSVEDFYRSDSKASCEHLIANCNMRIALRSNDLATSELMSRQFGTIDAPQRSSHLGGFDSARGGAQITSSRSLSTQQVPLFDAQYLGLLPNFEFMALLPNGQLYKGLIPRLIPSSFERIIASSQRYDLACHQQAIISGARSHE